MIERCSGVVLCDIRSGTSSVRTVRTSELYNVIDDYKH